VEASAVIEEYCVAIYNMAMEGDVVIGARLAEKFGVAPPTVTETLKRMGRDGLIEMDTRRQITLTPKGAAMAEAVLRRHRLTERFLVDMLGMQWHQVHEEACRLEHYISGAVEERVLASLGNPTTCPHGNPIPGCVPSARTYLRDQGAMRLLALESGSSARILCVSEVVEDEEELIGYLHDRGLTPGTHLTLRTSGAAVANAAFSRASTERSITVEVARQLVELSARAAHALWVVPE
jgi:DtxR family Mn-dependent transcriptional regulator